MSVAERVHFTLFALAVVACTAFLHYWNAPGVRVREDGGASFSLRGISRPCPKLAQVMATRLKFPINERRTMFPAPPEAPGGF